MRWTIFWTVAIAATLWNLFGLYDFIGTVAGRQDYLAGSPPEMIAWIDAFPAWRKAIWGLCVAAGLAGSVALLLRNPIARPLLWAAVVLIVLGFVGHDLLLADGARYYGTVGLAFFAILIGIQLLFALYAGWAARQGMLQRP